MHRARTILASLWTSPAVMAVRRLRRPGRRLPEQVFTSIHRRADVRWVLAVPKGVGPEGLPVVLALHARDGDARSVFDWLHVHRELDRFVRGGGRPFAIVAVDGGDASYWHPRNDGTDALRMLTDELLPRLAALGLRTDRIGVTGWSMGGLGVLNLARESSRGGLGPTRVVAGVATAPPVWRTACEADDGAYDDEHQFARWGAHLDAPGIDPTIALRVDCGDGDTFAPGVRAYRAAVPADGGFVAGGHDAPTWRGLLPAQLAFLATHLPAL